DAHPHAMSALAQLAFAYQGGFKMKQALELWVQARDTAVAMLGPEHPLTLRILRSLASMYRAYGRTAEAIALLEQVRERQVMVLGGQHPATLVTLNILALAYQDAGEWNKAAPLFHQAASGVEKLGYAHYDAGRILRNVSTCHEHLQQYDQAE